MQRFIRIIPSLLVFFLFANSLFAQTADTAVIPKIVPDKGNYTFSDWQSAKKAMQKLKFEGVPRDWTSGKTLTAIIVTEKALNKDGLVNVQWDAQKANENVRVVSYGVQGNGKAVYVVKYYIRPGWQFTNNKKNTDITWYGEPAELMWNIKLTSRNFWDYISGKKDFQ